MDLVTELKGTFPELEDIIDERYSDVVPEDASLLEWFEANAKEHHMALTTKDESVFRSNASLFLLPDINFSQLWKCKLTKSNKNAIWKYLHVLMLLVSHHHMQGVTSAVTSGVTTADENTDPTASASTGTPTPANMQSTFEQWNAMLDNKQLSPEELQAMQEQSEKIMKLMETLHNNNDDDEEEDDADNADGTEEGGTGKVPSMEDIKNDPFVRQLENSKIAQFAKELTEELDMKDLGLGGENSKAESFQDVFGMMGKDPQKMFGLVKTVGDKIQNKMQSGDIQQSELLTEAQNLMQSMQTSDTFKQMFKGGKKGRGKGKGGGGMDPHTLFKEMTKHIDPTMMQQAMAMMGNMQGMQGMQGMSGMPPMGGAGAPGATRARLQQKVAQKQAQKQAVDSTNTGTTGTTSTNNKKKKKKKKTKAKDTTTDKDAKMEIREGQ